MRIAIDTRLLGSGNHSGVEEYTQNIVQEFTTQNNNDQFIFFHNGLRIKELPKVLYSNKNIETINWHLPNRLLDLTFRFGLIQPQFKADVFFSPNLSSIQTKIPHIVTIHDLSFVHYPEFFTPLARAWHTTRVSINCKQATHIITDSEFTKNDLVNLYKVNPNKISVVYLGIDTQFKKLLPENEQLLNFKKTHTLNFPYILYLGTLEPRKNIPAIIRAFNILKRKNSLKDLHLILAGKKGWLYKDILKQAAQSPFKNHIIFWGPVKQEEKVFLYNLSQAFVYPSFFEGFGLPPIEAQACGVPIVASDRTSLAEILTNSALLINPWKVNDLADSLEYLLTQSKISEEFIQKGLENAKRFNWSSAGQATMAILKKYGKN